MATKGPRDVDKARHAAALIMLGTSRAETAKAAGIGLRTLERWLGEAWWPQMLDEARNDTHREIEHLALGTVRRALAEGDAPTARWALERLRPDTWGPGAQSVEVGPLRLVVEVPEPVKRGGGE